MVAMTVDEALQKCEKIYTQGKRKLITHKEARGMFAEVLLDLHETSHADGVDLGLRLPRHTVVSEDNREEANRAIWEPMVPVGPEAIDGVVLP